MKNEDIRATPFSVFVWADNDRSRIVPIEGRPYDDEEFCGLAQLPPGMVYSRFRVHDWYHEKYALLFFLDTSVRIDHVISSHSEENTPTRKCVTTNNITARGTSMEQITGRQVKMETRRMNPIRKVTILCFIHQIVLCKRLIKVYHVPPFRTYYVIVYSNCQTFMSLSRLQVDRHSSAIGPFLHCPPVDTYVVRLYLLDALVFWFFNRA